MGKVFLDTFTRANGPVGSMPGGPEYEALSGDASINNDKLVFSTSPDLNPIYAVPVGLRMNGCVDVEVSMLPQHVYGNALYARLADINNWIRMRVRTYRTSYQYYITEYEHDVYFTEYEYDDNYWQDTYRTRRWEYQYEAAITETRWSKTTVTPGYWTMGSWSSWTAAASPTGCRSGPPGTWSPVYGSSGNTIIEYRVVDLGTSGCSGGNRKYQQQQKIRSESWTPESSSTQYQWSYSNPGSGWSSTGQTRVVGQGLYYWAQSASDGDDIYTGNSRLTEFGTYNKTDSDSDTNATNPGQHTMADNLNDLYLYTSLSYRGKIWTTSSTPLGPDVFTGTTRQTYSHSYWDTVYEAGAPTRQIGPYIGYTYYYGDVVLEKCESGIVSTLESYFADTSSPAEMKLRAKGSIIQMFWGGTLVDQISDPSHMFTGSKVGIGGGPSDYNPTPPSIDNFSVKLLTPYKIRNAAGTAWLDCEAPKIRDASGSSWVEFDPLKVDV